VGRWQRPLWELSASQVLGTRRGSLGGLGRLPGGGHKNLVLGAGWGSLGGLGRLLGGGHKNLVLGAGWGSLGGLGRLLGGGYKNRVLGTRWSRRQSLRQSHPRKWAGRTQSLSTHCIAAI
jgi:hypothetical protein